MSNTTYRNASGLPDGGQVTTVRDQAILGIAVYQHFPSYYEFFQTTSFRYGNCSNHISCVGPIMCRVVTCTKLSSLLTIRPRTVPAPHRGDSQGQLSWVICSGSAG